MDIAPLMRLGRLPTLRPRKLLPRGRRMDDRLDEEMASHLDLATEDFVARGLSPDDARREALKGFGGVAQTREAHREARGFAMLDALAQDVRYAVRSYRQSPGFTSVAIVTLTLAIGANAAIVSLLNALVLRDLPVREPSTLVQITTSTRDDPGSFLTFPMFQSVARDQRVFSALMAEWRGGVYHVDTGVGLDNGLAYGVSGNLF